MPYDTRNWLQRLGYGIGQTAQQMPQIVMMLRQMQQEKEQQDWLRQFRGGQLGLQERGVATDEKLAGLKEAALRIQAQESLYDKLIAPNLQPQKPEQKLTGEAATLQWVYDKFGPEAARTRALGKTQGKEPKDIRQTVLEKGLGEKRTIKDAIEKTEKSELYGIPELTARADSLANYLQTGQFTPPDYKMLQQFLRGQISGGKSQAGGLTPEEQADLERLKKKYGIR